MWKRWLKWSCDIGKTQSLMIALVSVLTLSSNPALGVWSADWILEVENISQNETKAYRVKGGSVTIPTSMVGVSCTLSDIMILEQKLTRYIQCQSTDGIFVSAKTKVQCSPEGPGEGTLYFTTAGFEPEECHEDRDDRTGRTFCLPPVKEEGLRITLRCVEAINS